MAITTDRGAVVKAIRYEGSYSEDGVEYFLYGLAGNNGLSGFAARLDSYDFA